MSIIALLQEGPSLAICSVIFFCLFLLIPFLILASGTTGGDTYGTYGKTGSVIIIDYDRSTPLISIKTDSTSRNAYGPKDKIIVDKNIKDQSEASDKATSYLEEHKNPAIEGNL